MAKDELATLKIGETPDSLLTAALAAARAEFAPIEKGRTAEAGKFSYDYADLADIMAVTVPALSRHGLAVVQVTAVGEDGRIVLVTRLRHVGGGVEESRWPILFAANATPQQQGSAITYARRYQYVSILGVQPAREDDDGAAASNQPGPTDRPPPVQSGNGRHGVPSAQQKPEGPPTASQSGRIAALMKQHGLPKKYLVALSGEMFQRDRPATASEAAALIERIEKETAEADTPSPEEG